MRGVCANCKRKRLAKQFILVAYRITLSNEFFFSRVKVLFEIDGMPSIWKERNRSDGWSNASAAGNRSTNDHGHFGFERHISDSSKAAVVRVQEAFSKK